MVKELDNTIQIDNLAQVRSLLNRLLQSLDEQHTSMDSSLSELDKLAISEDSIELNHDDSTNTATDEQSEIQRLESLRDQLVGRLQREEYIGQQFEQELSKHQALMQTIKTGLRDRLVLESKTAKQYQAAVSDSKKTYKDNVEVLTMMTESLNGEKAKAKEEIGHNTELLRQTLYK